MIRLGSVILIVALGASSIARAAGDEDTVVVKSPGPAAAPLPELPTPATLPPVPLKTVPATTTPAVVGNSPSVERNSTTTAPVTTTSSNGFIAMLPPGSAPILPPSYYPQNGTGQSTAPTGGTAAGSPSGGQAFPNTNLTFPNDPKSTPNNNNIFSGPTSSGGNSIFSPSGGSTSPSQPSPAVRTGTGDEAPGLPSPIGTNKPTPAPPVKKDYLEGHVVLFLRAPGDEDPSPKGVLARFSREGKVVKRLANDVANGVKPATKPEDAVLRDPAPQGFYLPDEVDAWLVTADGSLVLLESENVNFDKIAALGLAAVLDVVGPQSPVALDPALGAVTKCHVQALTLDGSEPKADGAPGVSDRR
jgi:hypothetical protein